MDRNPSQYDELTGLLTRKAFEEKFSEIMAETIAKDSLLSIAFLDIDNFKKVNDEHGHLVGDAVLKTVAEVLLENGGEQVIAGRYGGDESILLFPNIEREQAFLMLERIRMEVASQNTFSEKKVNLSVSVSGGLATFPIDGRSEDELLRSADAAIYRAKVGGRNKIRLAQEERMVPKTAHYTQTQLERLAKLAEKEGVGEAVLLREALDNLLIKYEVSTIIER